MILISYICNYQFGFRPKHSTSSALLSFIDNVVKALDNKEILISLFLDLSKAFDCLDHSQLLCKLEYYGVRGILLN